MQVRNFVIPAIVSAVFATAQEAPRFAFFHPGHLVENTAQGRRVFADVQALGKRLGDAIRAKSEELQRLDQQLRSSSISEEGRGRITRELEDGRISLQRMQEDSQAQMQRAEQSAIEQFQKEISPIIEALAKEQNLHCVFQFQGEIIAWVDPTWVLKFTEEVAKRYDAAYPGGTPSTR